MSGDKIEKLLEAVDIEFYLDREAIEYRHAQGSSGAQLNLKICPVCGGDSWKVYLGADTGLGSCFHGSCSARWNKWSFIRAHLGGVGVPAMRAHLIEVAREQGWRPTRKTRAVEELVEWQMPPSYPLPTTDGRNLQYLEERGFDVDIVAYFRLRYCHEGWYSYQDEEGKRRGQKFDQRVLIPIFDLDGKLVTFQGRDITGSQDPKYLFPKRLPATGRFLYNGHNAIGARAVCAGEGFFDVAAIKTAFDAVPAMREIVPIGTFGKHLSGTFDSADQTDGADQLGAIITLQRAGLEEWTFMWDGEQMALEAALKAGDRIRRLGLRAYVALLPVGADPNEVPPLTVCRAYQNRIELTPASITKLRLRNPYKSRSISQR